jgi:hypothetical protein
MKSSGAGLLCGLAFFTIFVSGCVHPSITAVNLNDPKAPDGIPYYLPKTYLIITKNVRYIPAQSIGLTQSAAIPSSFDTGFDSSAGGGKGSGASTNKTSTSTSTPKTATGTKTNAVSLTAKSTAGDTNNPSDGSSGGGSSGGNTVGLQSIAVVPPGPISDGLVPQEFYTYNFVFLPDLTQKYGLRIKGGVGEMRATENLVNGWMHTGPGPIYFKDSSTAETLLASGQMVSDIGSTLGQIALNAAGIPTLPTGSSKGSGVSLTASNTGKPSAPGAALQTITNYAEIYIYEQTLTNDAAGHPAITWIPVSHLNFARDWVGLEQANNGGTPNGEPSSGTDNTVMDNDIAQQLGAKGWTKVTVQTDLETSSLIVNVTAAQAGKTADDLKKDTTDAATQSIKTESLTIANNQITVKAELGK